MISDQDRAIAEETFDLIERSTASGNSYEANLPIGQDTEVITVTPHPVMRSAILAAAGLPDLLDPADVSMALAEHTAPALEAIERAGQQIDQTAGAGVHHETSAGGGVRL